MSFCSELKSELSQLKTSECCRTAEFCAMLMLGKSFCINKACITSSCRGVIQNFCFLTRRVFGIKPDIHESFGTRPTYTAKICAADCEKIFTHFGANSENITEKIIDAGIVQNECCRFAFLRGAFNVCGQMQDLSKGLRVDLRIKNRGITHIIENIMSEVGLEFNVSHRNDCDVLYIKKSESVEDFITGIGAGNVTLKIIESRVISELRLNTNRRSNAEVANLSRVVESSLKQRSTIEKIIKSGKFETLPTALQETALLRMANPEASLTELCRLYSGHITKSGINRQLSALAEIAEKIQN